MQRAIWILLACCCAAAPAFAGAPAGGGGSASESTPGFATEAAASVKPVAATVTETAACPHANSIPGIMQVSPGQPIALYGVFDGLKGNQLTLTTKAGTKMTIDAGPALKSGETVVLVPHELLSVLGSRGADGTIHADVIRRAKGLPTTVCTPPG